MTEEYIGASPESLSNNEYINICPYNSFLAQYPKTQPKPQIIN